MKLLILAGLLMSVSTHGGKMSQIEKIKYVFTNLRADNGHILNDFYAENTHFEDPLGVHKGRESVKAYYKNLYNNVTYIDFEYLDTISQGNHHVLVWKMKLKADGLNSGNLVTLYGNSVIKFNEQNLVTYHRDYFDMGEFIYRYVPGLNWVIKKVNERLKSTPPHS